MIEFIHPVLDEEINAIGGHYVITKEKTLKYGDKKILYFIGYGVVDTSCCGPSGCGYAIVPGFIIKWHIKLTPDTKQHVSLVEPIDENLHPEISRIIRSKEGVLQVHFILPTGDRKISY